SRTLPTPRRYVSIVAQNDSGSTYTPLGDTWFRITAARVFSSTTYESGGTSALTASAVVRDLLSSYLTGTLSADQSQIDTTVFTIPELDYGQAFATPRQVLAAVNAYHDYLAGVDAERRLFFKARPVAPVAEIGQWSGAAFADAGDSGEELYNRVIVEATGPDGQPLREVRTATSPLLAAAGVTRSRTLGVNAATTTAAAQAIGDAWLATRTRRPTRGSVTVVGRGAARDINGGEVAPAQFLRWCGQMVRLTHRWDPDTGAWGRDGYISAVSYDPQTDTAQVSLDSPRDRLDAFLSRLAAVRGAGLPLS
ncbi:MAG TPA: hypothetical protein VNT51_00925, partial [Miltoncostaeaceae bacterium]|nr:hypothetical protein [Miltoncostaeaceae bacterium]